jgi:hypothetical protein
MGAVRRCQRNARLAAVLRVGERRGGAEGDAPLRLRSQRIGDLDGAAGAGSNVEIRGHVAAAEEGDFRDSRAAAADEQRTAGVRGERHVAQAHADVGRDRG